MNVNDFSKVSWNNDETPVFNGNLDFQIVGSQTAPIFPALKQTGIWFNL